jgi:DNA-binding transcriptional MerR regulator
VFRIGDFSRLARVSCRLLRYYDEIGLLKPSATGRDSGYRYYTAAQLGRLNRILVLRDMGFNLDEIARIVADNLSADELRGMLLMRRREVERVIESEVDRLRQIESRILQIETEGQLSADDVLLRDQPVRRIVAIRQTLRSFAEARQLAGLLLTNAPSQAGSGVLGNLLGISHAPEFELDDLDLEIGFEVIGELRKEIVLPDGRKLQQRELRAERVASCVRVGLPEHAHLLTAKIAQFVDANGYELSGPSIEVFLQRPNLKRMEDSVVEMLYPLTPVKFRAEELAGEPYG